MANPPPNTIFISYSRRQLYFAESLALHLQKEDLEIWFDLQQLHAGTVWSEGLNDGIQDASTLVLVVSKDSLASSYVEDEWKEVARKGNKLVLVMFEKVDLPEALLGLPTYDFRNNFKKNTLALAAYLKGETEPRYDKVALPNRLRLSTKFPPAIWLTLAAQFSVMITLILVHVFILIFFVQNITNNEINITIAKKSLLLLTISAIIGLWFAIPFLRHKQSYKKVKRSVLISTFLSIVAWSLVVFGHLGDYEANKYSDIVPVILLLVIVFNVFVYLIVIRRSIDFLRWMQPEDSLQVLRRRVHQPLVLKTNFDLDRDYKVVPKIVSYTIHNDPADGPFAKWITKIFLKFGHKKVTLSEDPQYHIAILSNRSSTKWVQEITRSYAGRLIFLIVTTIEFKDSLEETGRYQWVDAREMDKQDIIGLAKSLGDETAGKREAALESTPDKIDSWKMPSGIKLINTLLIIFGVYILVFGLTDLITIDGGSPENLEYSIVLVIVGIISFWLVGKGLFKRKIPALVLYAGIFLNVLLVHYAGNVFPTALNKHVWLFPALVLLVLLYSSIDGRYWLPNFNKSNADEVGVNKKIVRAFWKKRIIIVSILTIFIIGIALFIMFYSEKIKK